MANKHDPDRADAIDRGRKATIVEAVVTPYINERVAKVTQKLVAAYRSGDLTEQLMTGSIGEITALQDLLRELEHDQRLGIGAAEQEYG